MATRERLAQTSNNENKYSINGHKRTPGSNEQYGIDKYSINGHKRTPGSNEQYEVYAISGQISNEQYEIQILVATRERLAQTSNNEIQIFNKWPQENAWLKRAI